MTTERELGPVLEAWMREDAPMPDDLDEVLRSIGSDPRQQRRSVSVPAWPWREMVMFNATKVAAVVAVVALSGLLLALVGPWTQVGPSAPSATMSEAESVDALMLAVHDPEAPQAEAEAAVTAAFGPHAFVRDVRPGSSEEARGRAEIMESVARGESWQRTAPLRLLAPVGGDSRYLGIYEVAGQGAGDGEVRTAACVITLADGLITSRECSHGGPATVDPAAQDDVAALALADDRFLEALNEPVFWEVKDRVVAAFATDATFGIFWNGAGWEVLEGEGDISTQFSDPMTAIRLEPPVALPAQDGWLRYVGVYDYTYDAGNGRAGYWPGTVCSGWLDGDRIDRMDCLFPEDSIVTVDG